MLEIQNNPPTREATARQESPPALKLRRGEEGEMPEERFELNGYFKTEEGKLVPFSLQITRDTLTISARTRKDKEPYSESLEVIKSIDEFLHRATPHEPSKECEKPERILFFLRWIPRVNKGGNNV